VSATEKVARDLLEEVLPRIEELEAEALARVAEAAREAGEKVARVEAAREELAEVEAEIESMREEREEIPGRAYRAGLDGEYQEEDRLKERYANLKPAIEASERRRSELGAEIAPLLPRLGGDRVPSNAHVRGRYAGEVAQVSHYEQAHLRRFRDRLVGAADAAAEALAKEHRARAGQVLAWENIVNENAKREEAARRAGVGA